MYVNVNSENFSAPTKATSGRPAYSPALYQIQSAIAKLLVSFRCQVKIREGQARETARCLKQTLKLLNEHVRNLLLKIIRTPPQALNKCVRNLLLKIIRTTNFEQLFFKLLRNERISRCAIYFERLSAKDYSNCI